MSMIPVRSQMPGAKSLPAPIRFNTHDGLGRIMGGQRYNMPTLSGLAGLMGLGQTICNAFDDQGNCIGTQDLSDLPTFDTTYNGPGEPYIPITLPNTPSTVGSAPASINPAAVTGAISSLNQTAAILQGGSVINGPGGTSAVYGSGTTAAVAAAANPLGTVGSSLSSMIVPLVVIGGLFMVMSMGRR